VGADVTARRPSAWLLNLDAEDELASGAHTPSAKTRARMADLVHALGPLIAPGDVVVTPDVRAPSRDFVGRAWCPTPRALDALVRAGATPAPAPPLSVLRRVNHRRFAADLGQGLPGARYVTTDGELRDAIAKGSPTGHWLLKRPFGFAGRGRRRVAAGALEASAETWVAASLAGGEGLQVEPWVARLADYALHGHLSVQGTCTWGAPTAQRCDENGAWQGTALATDLPENQRRALAAAAERVAAALAEAGYFGPFGIDAYAWRDGDRVAFHAMSEINARYSMGWAIGMGDRRPDLDG
jgi:hypothetical protein